MLVAVLDTPLQATSSSPKSTCKEKTMFEQTDLTPLSTAEIDHVSGGVFTAVLAVGALIIAAYSAGYARGENEGEKTCPAN